MYFARTIALALALCLVADVRRAAAQDPPATDETLTPEMEKQIERERLEAEVAGLPQVHVKSIEEAVKFTIENDQLAASTTLTPIQGEVRIVHPALPGVVRMRVHDLQAIGDVSSGRNFSYVQQDLTQPGTLLAYTHVNALAGRLNLARDAQSDTLHSQVELIQDPPGTPPELDTQPVRLMVRIIHEREELEPGGEAADEPREAARARAEAEGVDAPAQHMPEDVNITVGAPTFTELRQRYPREVEMYLRPILRDFQQDHRIFAVDERVAWQVLGGAEPPGAQATEQVSAVLAKFDSTDFREREAALDELRRLGQPAATILAGADRSGFSAEQNAGVDEFLAEYLPLSETDVQRLRSSPDFLLDTLASDNPALRKVALEQLRRTTATEIAFDPDAPAERRTAQLDELRRAISPAAPTTLPAPKS